jgi:hypothetical protein
MIIMKNKQIFSNPLFIAGLLSVIVIVLSAQSLLLKPKTFVPGGKEYTHYNNYIIFKQSFFHLTDDKDLYQFYPAEHWDLYKYSPTFALLMAPLAILPDALGLAAWNLLNMLVLFFALWKLPQSTNQSRLLMLAFILLELITSVQNSQSNALIAGLIIFAFISLERKQTALAALFILLTVFIKIFGLLALSLFLFYPNKFRAVLYSIGWTLLLLFLPLIVISMPHLGLLYQSWYNQIVNDHSVSFGFSVAGWLYTWFGVNAKNSILLLGLVLFCLPLIKYKFFNELKFRLFFLASILIWIVIFNHKAESPTFIIAISGVAIWGFSQKLKKENILLLIVALIFTVLSPTDLFPKNIRNNFIVPYVLKVVPCILIWLKITFDMMFYKPENYTTNTLSEVEKLKGVG